MVFDNTNKKYCRNSNLKIKIFGGNEYLKCDPSFNEKFDKIRKVMHSIFNFQSEI